MVHWNISGENLSLLDEVQDLKAGTLEVEGRNIDQESLKRVRRFVEEQGVLLHTLIIRPQWSMEYGDWKQLDFVTCCPRLRKLELERVTLNTSVFAHPSLEKLHLLETDVSASQPITVGDGSRENDGRQLKEMSIVDSRMWSPDMGSSTQTLTIGPAAQLNVFQDSLDEDSAEPGFSPDSFVFRSCPQLEGIGIHVCWSWTVLISGFLPRLSSISLNAEQYGSYEWQIEGVDAQQEARYRQMLE